MLTGGYSNYFKIYSTKDGKTEIPLHADKSAFKSKRQNSAKAKVPAIMRRGKDKDGPPSAENTDFDKKILHAAWHPQENSIAVAATNNLFIFSQLWYYGSIGVINV